MNPKLTLVSVTWRGIRKSVFVEIAPDSNGKFRIDYNKILEHFFPHLKELPGGQTYSLS